MHPDAMAAMSVANQPRPIAAPMATLLTVSLATAPVEIWKLVLDAPLGTDTLGGTAARLERLLLSVTANPPGPAGAFSSIQPRASAPP